MLLKRINAQDGFIFIAFYPATTMSVPDGIKQVNVFVFVVVRLRKPLGHFIAGIPAVTGYKVKQILAFITDSLRRYTANWHNFTLFYVFDPPTLPRWEREFMKSAGYASSQYIYGLQMMKYLFLWVFV